MIKPTQSLPDLSSGYLHADVELGRSYRLGMRPAVINAYATSSLGMIAASPPASAGTVAIGLQSSASWILVPIPPLWLQYHACTRIMQGAQGQRGGRPLPGSNGAPDIHLFQRYQADLADENRSRPQGRGPQVSDGSGPDCPRDRGGASLVSEEGRLLAGSISSTVD